MKTYLVKTEQAIPISLAEAWDFFSSPLNLAKITPKEMSIVVTSNQTTETKIYPGMIITYKISPLLGIKMNWMTEITHVKEGEYFADEQRFGPYALWHHQHHFKAIKGGVLMNDILNYAIPYGFIGQLSNALFVRKEIKEIFEYREKAIREMFGELG
ncbi:SRPBCC family protein [Mucilaginibacter sp. OK098]|uniref:SRPBCC family protein n=1 Tax=Mucilaginibacter sp. OK098 TaxID=1855297 RepID=UPI00091F1F0E|nr:SRPBCC family protein [Mucilaginibacter sp. OK098]SHN07244.1 Ligand-binding SRPBCC domain-containing protein [Mucilaginibacter sp. OK098]